MRKVEKQSNYIILHIAGFRRPDNLYCLLQISLKFRCQGVGDGLGGPKFRGDFQLGQYL